MKKYKNLTIFFVSYYSKKKIKKLIKRIDDNIKILIIDNAREKNIKKFFKKNKNVKVIVNKFNSGQTGGINTGLKNIKTKYSIYMDSDISFKKDTINNFLWYANKIKNFIILAPQHEKNEYDSSFKSKKKNEFNNIILMKMVHGHFLLFNSNNVKKVGLYDENIFLYFDETDYCLRAYRKNQRIFVIPEIKVRHQGGKSIEINNSLEIEANKHWHFMWSKFYFYKKNYSLLYGLKKTIIDLFLSFLKMIIFFPINNRKNKIYSNQFNGLINSYLGNNSFRRIKL